MLPQVLRRAHVASKSWRDGVPRAIRGHGLGARVFLQRRWASKEKNDFYEEKPFYLQLQESIYERVQRMDTERKELNEIYDRELYRRWTRTLAIMIFCGGMGFFWASRMPWDPPTNSTMKLDMHTVPPKHNISEANMEAAWIQFRDILGRENLSLDHSELESHSGNSWSSRPMEPGDIPFCIVKPATTEQVGEIMKICNTYKIPVTPYSGGNSLEGQTAATRGGVCIDFARMDQILKIHKTDLDVVVQPAVSWERLEEALAKENLFFPPDPGPSAMIGGMIGTGCSGASAYRYGTMKEWVLSLTVVLADGTIIKTRQRPRKSLAGYDLTRMFIGSEGTLGLVTEATLKVMVKPQQISAAVCSFPTIRAAADCVTNVVSSGVPVAAVEMLDDVQMQCINDSGSISKTWKVAPTLFFKFAGTPGSVKEQVSHVQGLAKKAGALNFDYSSSEREKQDLWQARRKALWSVLAKSKDGDDMAVWTTDVVVPISHLSQIMEETKEDIRESGLLGSMFGHVGDGNFHTIVLYNRHTDFTKAKALVDKMVHRAIELEGSCTGEHGVGLTKREYLKDELGETTVQTMRQLKKALDPLCLLNCDKVVNMQWTKDGPKTLTEKWKELMGIY